MTNSPSKGRFVLWRRLDMPGTEYCRWQENANGWTLQGQVIVALDGWPLSVRYQLTGDATWATRAIHIETISPAGEQILELTVDAQHRWWSAGAEVPALAGCIDVDLGVTPSTNTLPIRRLHLAPGEQGDLVAAWVRFPEGTVEPLAQRYTRLAAQRYRYASDSFTADLETDDLGLVRSYARLWICEAAHAAKEATGE